MGFSIPDIWVIKFWQSFGGKEPTEMCLKVKQPSKKKKDNMILICMG